MNYNLNNWMSRIDGGQELFLLSIPGTHDCVTQFVQFPHISKCQNTDIYGQLCMGVRALDIRVQSSGYCLKTVHGIAKAFNTPNRFGAQMDIDDVLKHIYRFLEENNEETVIFQFKNDSGKEQEKCFKNLYLKYICKNKNKWYLENKVPTLDQVRGKIVLIRRCNADMTIGLYDENSTGIDFSRWVEQTQAVPEPLVLKTKSDGVDFIIQDRYKYKPIERWNECIKPFLDKRSAFDGRYVICYLSTAGGLKGPENNAKYINSEFEKYPLDANKYYGTIYLDFPTEKLTRKIINHNF